MKAAEMQPGAVYSHSKLGLLSPVLWYTEREEIILRDMFDGTESNGRGSWLLVLLLSKSNPSVGELYRISREDEVHKAFGIY